MKSTLKEFHNDYYVSSDNQTALKAILGISAEDIFWLRVDIILDILKRQAHSEKEYQAMLNSSIPQAMAMELVNVIEDNFLHRTRLTESGMLTFEVNQSNKILIKESDRIEHYKLFSTRVLVTGDLT